MPRFSANDRPFLGPCVPGTAGEEFVACGPGLCSCGGSLKPGGKPAAAGPGPPGGGGPPGVTGRRFGCGWAGGFCLETEKAFILAMRSGFNAMGAPLPPIVEVGGGLPLAAFKVPSGVEEGFMLETVDAEPMSEVVRGAGIRLELGLPRGEDCDSPSGVASGDVGGDGESSGDCASSHGEAMLRSGAAAG